MGVNRYKKHLVVFLEDKPYRSIVNGMKNLPNVKYDVMDIKNPCGGWGKVFDELEKNLHLLRNPECNILLLMDFDDREGSSLTFESRKRMLNAIVPPEYTNRLFLLGVNHEESEALKDFFGMPQFEKIGQRLIKDCPSGDLSDWQNTHLECNLSEIERMRENGVFDWLFNT
jgi:hypothetical protein